MVEIGTAEFQPDGNVLVDVLGTTPDVARKVLGHGDFRFVLQREHFPFADELEIMRLPALGTIEFERRALRIGDSISLAELGSGEFVFDLREVASGDLAREPEAHEETAW
ncbi:MAG TPA: hypothetical protein VES62_07350 [Thermoleophilaceae bacterium]|nr:hypothetical protein [Thermoleophilaceae bacterium]